MRSAMFLPPEVLASAAAQTIEVQQTASSAIRVKIAARKPQEINTQCNRCVFPLACSSESLIPVASFLHERHSGGGPAKHRRFSGAGNHFRRRASFQQQSNDRTNPLGRRERG
jgi:hypothetical protein